MGEALGRGMTLTMSIWDDFASQMLWLDAPFPAGADQSKPGVVRGPCSADSGNPADIRGRYQDSYVKYFNIKVGPINTTYASKSDFSYLSQ